MNIALDIQGLTHRYGKKTALHDISFQVPQGAICGLVGPNGAGKTTLMSIVASLLVPNKGEVRLFDHRLSEGRPPRGTLGILPQEARLQGATPVRTLLRWYARLQGLTAAEAEREVERVLDLTDARKFAHQIGRSLSAGMHKRVALAQLFIGSPRLLLLDEPTSALDMMTTQRIREIIRELGGKHTLLVSSHNIDEVQQVCDHVVLLDHGRVVRAGHLEEISGHESRVTITLTQIATTAQLQALSALDFIDSIDSDNLRLRCELTAEQATVAGVARVVDALHGEGMDFTQLQRGVRLEDRFEELTAEKPAT
jgi:ABC-type multidrug transport system ATPase subunit